MCKYLYLNTTIIEIYFILYDKIDLSHF